MATPTVPGEPGKGRDVPSARRFCGPICCSPQLLLARPSRPTAPHRLIAANVELDPIYPDGPNLPSAEAPAVFQENAQWSHSIQTLLLQPAQQIHSFLPAHPQSQKNSGKVETGRERWRFHPSRGLLSSPLLKTRI